MGMDCRMITDDFRNEINNLKNNKQSVRCNNEDWARRILTDFLIPFSSVDEVIKEGEYYSVNLKTSYAFYDEKFVLIAYLDIDEEKLYF